MKKVKKRNIETISFNVSLNTFLRGNGMKNFVFIKNLLLLICFFFTFSGCNLVIEIIGNLEPEPVMTPTPESFPDPTNNQETFTIIYYNDSEMTQPLNENPILKDGTYYVLITSSMSYSLNPVITIDSEGFKNDIDSCETMDIGDGSYLYIRNIVIDSASSGRMRENISVNGIDPVNESTHAAFIDTVPPVGDFYINNDETTTYDQTVILSIVANDTSSHPVSMMISNSGGFDGAAWLPYADTYTWTLVDGEGNRDVYMKFRDTAGNESPVVMHSIYLMLIG